MPVSAISLSQEFIDAANIVYNDGALSAGGISPLFVTGQAVVSAIAADSFFARAYTDSSGNIIIAYRGTTDLSTIFGADLALANGEFIPALHDAINFANSVRTLVGTSASIYVTGHSLGGAEAEAVASNLSFISGGMTFGAPGLPAVAHGSVTPTNFIDYVEYLDPVGNAANDAFNPLYSFTNPPRMGAHVGSVNYIGDLQTHIVSAIPGINLLTSAGSLGVNLLTSWAGLSQSADAFHGLDVYAGNLSLALNGASPVTQQQSSTINSAVTRGIAQQVVASSSAATPTASSYPVVTVADHIPALANATIPIGAFFSAHEAPSSSGHHVDHYSVFVV